MAETEYTRHLAIPDVTAFVLTGGKSERMGQDKATLRLPSGNTLLEHALAVAGEVAGEVRIVGPRERYSHLAWAGEIVEDIYPHAGPLAGIHAALSQSGTEWNLIIAVDLPRVTSKLLLWLIEQAKTAGKQVAIVSVGKGVQPLCAVYRRDFAATAERALEQGRYKVDASFDPAETHLIAESELSAAGFSPELFTNVNTPDEFRESLA